MSGNLDHRQTFFQVREIFSRVGGKKILFAKKHQKFLKKVVNTPMTSLKDDPFKGEKVMECRK